LPRFSFRIPHCERGLEALSNYHSIRATSTGLAVDEPVHDWASHAADALRTFAEADAANMLSSAGSTANVHRRPVTVRAGYRGDDFREPEHTRPLLWQATEECAGDSVSEEHDIPDDEAFSREHERMVRECA
jgi:hypothetical protein